MLGHSRVPYFVLFLFGWPLSFFDSLRFLNRYLVGWSRNRAEHVVLDLADLHLGGNSGNPPGCTSRYFQSRDTPLSTFSSWLYNLYPVLCPWTSGVSFGFNSSLRYLDAMCVAPKAWVVVVSIMVGSWGSGSSCWRPFLFLHLGGRMSQHWSPCWLLSSVSSPSTIYLLCLLLHPPIQKDHGELQHVRILWRLLPLMRLLLNVLSNSWIFELASSSKDRLKDLSFLRVCYSPQGG